MLLRILLGLLGLGLVVFIHELGHFIAARLSGIDVEAFSIGWGRPILSRKIGAVEYRLGMFPVGGYCKMRGEAEFREALTKGQAEFPRDAGTFYGAHPLKRICTALAGPLANVVFAIIVLSVIWGIGFEVRTLDNRIVLASEIETGAVYPADEAGLRTGDRIVEIAGARVTNYLEIQEAVAPNAQRPLAVIAEREGVRREFTIVPRLDAATGAGKIGVYFWTDPVLESVAPGSPAAIAGLRPGDRILSVQGEALPYTAALYRILRSRPTLLSLQVERDGATLPAELVLSYDDSLSVDLGLEFVSIRYHTGRLSIPAALAKGASESWTTFSLSVRSFALLFKGVDLTRAVSGPVRITYMVGEVAAEGFGRGIGAGISALANFLALISIALCIMNLLPIPALDGGMVILFIIEMIFRRPLHPKAVYYFQMIGTFIILALLLFSVFGDILFLFGRSAL